MKGMLGYEPKTTRHVASR